MKSSIELHEGPEAFTRFQNAMRKVIAVPNAVIKEKIEVQRKASVKYPNRRGPKPKASASRAPGA